MQACRISDTTAVHTTTAIDKEAALATIAIRYVLDNFADEIELDDLASAAGMTRFNFCRRFQRECGISPIRWLWNFRTMLAAEFIAMGPDWSLTDVAFSCGFTSSAHFSRAFKQMYRVSPSQYRKTHKATAKPHCTMDHMFIDNERLVMRTAQAALTGGDKSQPAQPRRHA